MGGDSLICNRLRIQIFWVIHNRFKSRFKTTATRSKGAAETRLTITLNLSTHLDPAISGPSQQGQWGEGGRDDHANGVVLLHP